ncbi:MAG: hypothetical protein WD045_10065 [Pirellulaceae bacterium]|jgi:hypothetical protein
MPKDPHAWLEMLRRWPKDLPKRGVLVTTLNEQIPFVGYALDGFAAVVQRQTPDSLGARQVIIPYTAISYLKITAVVPPKMFVEFGFEGELPKA